MKNSKNLKIGNYIEFKTITQQINQETDAKLKEWIVDDIYHDYESRGHAVLFKNKNNLECEFVLIFHTDLQSKIGLKTSLNGVIRGNIVLQHRFMVETFMDVIEKLR